MQDAAAAQIRSQFPELAEKAEREQMSYLGFLAELLLAECDDRARRRSERRIKAAGFPATRPCASSTSTPTPTSMRP